MATLDHPKRPAKKEPGIVTGPVIKDISHYRLKSARVLDRFRLCLRFKDDFIAELDFEKWISSGPRGPLIRPLADEQYFQQVYLDHGALTWPNKFDIDPCAIRHWAEQGRFD